MNKPLHNQFKEVTNLNNWIKAYNNIMKKKEDLFKDKLKHTSFDNAKWLFRKAINDIKKNNYKPRAVKIIKIQKDSGNVRRIGVSSDIDKVLQKVIADILLGIYDKSFSKHSYAFRKGKSILNIVKELSKRLIQANVVLKYDIKEFFDNIDHTLLKNILKNKIYDNKFLDMIYKFLNVEMIDNNTKTRKDIGLIQGSPMANILSNVYMDGFDKYIETIIKDYPSTDITYIRYCDDFVIGMNNYKATINIDEKVEQYLTDNLKLNLNKDKSKVVYLNEGDALDFAKLIFAKKINAKKKRSIKVSVDTDKMKARLNEKLVFDNNDKYTLKRNFRKYNGFILYYYKTVDFDVFSKLIEDLKDITDKLEHQEHSVYGSNTTYEYKKLNDRLSKLSFYNSFVDQIYQMNKNIFSQLDEKTFMDNISIFNGKFKQYNMDKPDCLVNLENKILSFYKELSKKDKGSNGYNNKMRKIMTYQESYFGFCLSVFIDDNPDDIVDRINKLEENNFNNDLLDLVYDCY